MFNLKKRIGDSFIYLEGLNVQEEFHFNKAPHWRAAEILGVPCGLACAWKESPLSHGNVWPSPPKAVRPYLLERCTFRLFVRENWAMRAVRWARDALSEGWMMNYWELDFWFNTGWTAYFLRTLSNLKFCDLKANVWPLFFKKIRIKYFLVNKNLIFSFSYFLPQLVLQWIECCDWSQEDLSPNLILHHH